MSYQKTALGLGKAAEFTIATADARQFRNPVAATLRSNLGRSSAPVQAATFGVKPALAQR